MHTIAIANQKGGCGKTTTAINLSACLGLKGKKALLIDLDPQAHASIGVNSGEDSFPRTIYDALMNPRVDDNSLVNLAQPIVGNFDFIPSDSTMLEAERQLERMPRRHERLLLSLQEMANRFKDAYDYVVIDCPPSIGPLTENAFFACDEALLTIETSFFALHGIARLLDFIQHLKDMRPQPLQIRALATMYDQRKNLAKEVLQDIKAYFGDLHYETVIRVNVKLEEAASFGLPITEYSKRCAGYQDYMALADEVITASNNPQ